MQCDHLKSWSRKIARDMLNTGLSSLTRPYVPQNRFYLWKGWMEVDRLLYTSEKGWSCSQLPLYLVSAILISSGRNSLLFLLSLNSHSTSPCGLMCSSVSLLLPCKSMHTKLLRGFLHARLDYLRHSARRYKIPSIPHLMPQ